MSSEGYLIKKTIQQFPIRHRPIYYEDYTDQNLLLFINKKLADVRFQSGSNDLSAKRIMNLKIMIPKNKSTEQQKVRRKVSFKALSAERDVPEKKFRYKFRSPPVKPEVRLASQINDELLRQHSIGPLYQEYKLANLKANLVRLQAKKTCQLNELNHVEFQDEEQVNYFLSEILRNHPEISVEQLLQVDVEKKELRIDQQQQTLKELIEKKLKEQETLARLEQQYTQNLVNIYKETRYDQFEPELKKQGMINMCKIKRQKEIQDRMFAEIFKQKQASNHIYRKSADKHHKTTQSQQFNVENGIFISQPPMLSPRTSVNQDLKPSQMTTSIGSESRYNGHFSDLSLKLKMIMERCEVFETEQKVQNETFRKKINVMGKELTSYFDTARSRYKNQNAELDHNEGFDRFLQENQFRRKLIDFQVSQVQNLHEVLSQRAKREVTNNFMGNDNKQKLF